MEPVITESGREADETDSAKVCVRVFICKPLCFFTLKPASELFRILLLCRCVSLLWFVCFPIAPYLMRCKSSVKVAQLP